MKTMLEIEYVHSGHVGGPKEVKILILHKNNIYSPKEYHSFVSVLQYGCVHILYCVGKPEKFRTSTGFEPVTLRYQCDTLTN